VLVLLGAALRAPALTVIGGEADASGFSLAVDARYLWLAPLHALLDQLSLLTISGHAAVVVTVAVAGLVVGARLLPRTSPRIPGANAQPPALTVQWRAACVGGGTALLATCALCAWGALGYRPMLRLTGTTPHELVLDLHAHTNASHDGRSGWSRERLSEWLASAGFHAAYVTDHGTLWPDSWHSALPAGHDSAGVRLLPGIEVRGMGEHLNVLGVTARDSTLFWDRGRRLALDALRARLALRDTAHVAPLVLVTSPLKRREPLDRALVHAVEVSDASPKGLSFGWMHRRWLARLVDSLRLVPLSGTDQHGWGRAAASWTVLHLPGWRGLPPEALDRAIRRHLRQPAASVTVLERPPLPGTGRAWGVVLTVPLVAHALLTRISWPERLAWLAWCWGCWCLVVAGRASAPWRDRARRLVAVRLRRALRARALARRAVARPSPARSLSA
jgi:predicted metal-dependent phosphoesterase TrpH